MVKIQGYTLPRRVVQMEIDEYLVLHFWLPIILLPLGVGLAASNEKSRRNIGLILLLLISFSVISFSEQLNSSIEAWSLHLLISIIGPVAALLFGIWFALFSGPIPVSPLPRSVRPFGFAMMLLSLLWFLWMLFESRPMIEDTANPWWQHLVTSFLTALVVIAGFASAFALIMGDERIKETLILGILSVSSFLILIYLLAEGTNSDDPVYWRSSSWGVLGDLSGMLVGSGSGLLLFIYFVWVAEKRTPAPEEVSPLTESETERVKEILKDNLEVE